MSELDLKQVERWNFSGYDGVLGRIRKVDSTYHPGIWDEAARLERGWKREAVHNKNLVFNPNVLFRRFFNGCRPMKYKDLAADLATALVAKSIWEAWNEQ